MLKRILSISGRPGLWRLVSNGKNMLIVESLKDGHRTPIYARDKVVGLGDITIYMNEEDKPLGEVLELVKNVRNGESVDLKTLKDGADLREFFGTAVPDFDRERVNTSDIKKLLSWYNQLLEAGITDFKNTEDNQESTDEKTPEE